MNVIDFLKRHMFTLLAALLIIAMGVYYLYERGGQSAVITAEAQTPAVVIGSLDEGAETENGSTIKVYIAGEVVNPGVYETHDGARIDDVLKLAGGGTPEADLISINLAAYVADAQRIIIPKTGGSEAAFFPMDGSAVISDSETVSGTGDDGLININTASRQTLETLPGIGPVLAQSIIDYREKNGGFKNISEIMQVSRIGSATYETLKDKIKVE